MAKYIGKMLSGTMLTLCAVSFMAPQAWGQIKGGGRIKLTISGSIGMPGVTMQGLPDTKTDENGVYTAQVDWGFSGTVTPVRAGYTFEPQYRTYANVKENHTKDDYQATAKKYTLSGSAGVGGVKMRGLPNDPNTDADGRYSVSVTYGFTGVVTPEKPGWQFDPPVKPYDPVSADQTVDFKASPITYTISGTVSVLAGDANGVALQGMPKDAQGRFPQTGSGGVYRVIVPYGWSGKVTPVKDGYTFEPTSKQYDVMTESRSNEDYVGKVFEYPITGTTKMAGVMLKVTGIQAGPVSDANGFYSVTVPYGWHGKITPEYRGYAFNPPFQDITQRVTGPRDKVDFQPSEIRPKISGIVLGAGSGVKMAGLPGEPLTDDKGAYSVTVDFGWSGTVVPTKEGWSFDEASKTYASVEADQTNQNYKASPITYTISGNVGQGGVILDVVGPGGKSTVSKSDGSYSIVVPHHWTGVVTPKKPNLVFDPLSQKYEQMTRSEMKDYAFKVVQFVIHGKVVCQAGPVEGATLTATPGTIGTTTDPNGEYKLAMDYGWTGSIKVEKPGYTFAPDVKPVAALVSNIPLPGISFSGSVQMRTITSIVAVNGEPIGGVIMTATPGNYKSAPTDAKGKYTISVPYGWSGKLTPTKEGWEFVGTEDFENVIQNIDKTKPASDIQPPGQPEPPGPTQPPGQKSQGELDRQKLIDALKQIGINPPDANARPTTPVPPDGKAATGGNLIDVLSLISQKTGAKIAVDLSVKPAPVTVNVGNSPAPVALEQVLNSITGKPYKYKLENDTYLVFKPINATLEGRGLRDTLQQVSDISDVPIMVDEGVTGGQVSALLKDVPLERALEMVLSGTSYTFKKMPGDYYIVGSVTPEQASFRQVSITKQLWLNYLTAPRAAEMLPVPWARYVRAGSDPNGHALTIIAPPDMAARLIEDIKKIDRCPRMVLLTARIVGVDQGDTLNLGIQWTPPSVSMGAFSNSYVRGTFTGDDPAGSWPWGIQMGYSPDKAFTNALVATINALKQNGQLDIVASPQVLTEDGKEAQIKQISEEWFMMTAPQSGTNLYVQSELRNIESGTVLTMTPRIADNNDIRLEMAVEVSDSVPKGTTSDLPVVTRRQAKNTVIVHDGGSAAVAGLREHRARNVDSAVPILSSIPVLGPLLFKNHSTDKSQREIAVFVTATIVTENAALTLPPAGAPGDQASSAPAAGGSFQDELRSGLASQPR